ncbi:DinB family protein [Rhodocytophaga aerolata]|uniref:DinB family protein n=1 Tax=Rhodocytophaga aerolata TaxID=455078 RepID=A0ABT8RAF5_9BACT|nr:DinB family protein [Rhodocytophaga aerolata]MDO1448238.1 DinB family protein [Rhodocytophaga aerolata]
MKILLVTLSWAGMVWLCFACHHSLAQTSAAEPSQSNASQWAKEERRQLLKLLSDSRQLLLDELMHITVAQWTFKPSPDKWSIAEVVEHLGLQQDAYYRELSVVTLMPPMPQYQEQVKGLDDKILQYTHQEKKDQAPWLLEPMGRWCSQEKAIAQFVRSHSKIIGFIEATDADFRSHFTFRQYTEGSLWNIRDLHQLMLTNVAHTQRHVNQIRNIKKMAQFPK